MHLTKSGSPELSPGSAPHLTWAVALFVPSGKKRYAEHEKGLAREVQIETRLAQLAKKKATAGLALGDRQGTKSEGLAAGLPRKTD